MTAFSYSGEQQSGQGGPAQTEVVRTNKPSRQKQSTFLISSPYEFHYSAAEKYGQD